MTNPNTNCLAGMRCPKCGSYGPYRIAASVMVMAGDDGIEDQSDFEWNDTAYCECAACGHKGTVATFTEGN